jgi:hypothetical protein
MHAIEHKNNKLFTRAVQGVFIPLESCSFVGDKWIVE